MSPQNSTRHSARLDEDEPIVRGVEKHLYIAELPGLGVRIGVTETPEKHLRRHRAEAASFGRKIGRVWISPPHVDARDNEKLVKRLGSSRRDHLAVDFDTAIEYAQRLSMVRATRSQQQREAAIKPTRRARKVTAVTPQKRLVYADTYTPDEAAKELRALGFDTGSKRLVKLLRELRWATRDEWGTLRAHPEAGAVIRDLEATDVAPAGVELSSQGLSRLVDHYSKMVAAA